MPKQKAEPQGYDYHFYKDVDTRPSITRTKPCRNVSTLSAVGGAGWSRRAQRETQTCVSGPSNILKINNLKGLESSMIASDSSSAMFELYDLRVEVVHPPDGAVYCGAKAGDHFELRGEMLHLPPGQGFSIYSLAALLPLLPAKQRKLDPADWMASDAEVACPDPNCTTRFRINRLGLRRFDRSEVTAVPLPETPAP